jgi:hypothetical protein
LVIARATVSARRQRRGSRRAIALTESLDLSQAELEYLRGLAVSESLLFHKYLIDKQGRPIQAWSSKVEPSSPEVAGAIEAQLAL